MSQKKPTPDTAASGEASGEAQGQEPIVVKEPRFWNKKSKSHGADAPADPTPKGSSSGSKPEEADANDPAPADLTEPLVAQIAALEHRLQEKEARLNATVAQYKEALEEFEGAKARLKRDVAKDVARGKRDILVGLLEVVDNLERALGAASAGASEHDGFKAFFEGVTMVRDQFLGKLKAMGVERLESLGEPFDPAHFEAISTVPVQEPQQHDTVVGVVRDAYVLSGETLRHGIVAVGKHTPA